uniref:Uncharacterized protein n=1 Tax=viral metagenome TaxID=1070528 RepID=A0A6C0ANP4_9ZZZZ
MSDLIIGQMTGLTNSQFLQYSDAARIFLRVQAFNQAIRIKRIAGNKTISYYTFVDNTERTLYKQGQFILSQNDPISAAGGLYDDIAEI